MIRFDPLSLALIHYHSFLHSLSLIAILCTTCCHWLSFDILLVCVFISDPRKTSKDQEKTFAYALQYESSDKNGNVQRKFEILFLKSDFIKTVLHHGHIIAERFDYFFGNNI